MKLILKFAVFCALVHLIFAQDPLIFCSYGRNQILGFTYCQLSITNPNGYDGFTQIPGPHRPGETDDDVWRVEATTQWTTNVPRIFCSQFRFLRDLHIIASRVTVISSSALENCQYLQSFYLAQNPITQVPPDLFTNNAQLQFINFQGTELTDFPTNFFAPTTLRELNINGNRLERIDQEWFGVAAAGVRVINIMSNEIHTLTEGCFNGMSGLTRLSLDTNPLEIIPENVFDPLESLEELSMTRCGLNILNARWFKNLYALTNLNLGINDISELPEGIFESLRNIIDLTVSTNRITEINSNSFYNASLASIENVNFADNLVDAIDPGFFDNAVQLNRFILSGNICVSQSFMNVGLERESVRERLQPCFDNFAAKK